MDYTKKDLIFKIKKTLRYFRIYGIRRTIVKIRGQYHMNRIYVELPDNKGKIYKKANVGIIGCGNYSYSNIAYYLNKNFGRIIRGCMDVNLHRAASLAATYGAQYYTDNAKKILEDEGVKVIYIASNHSTHAEYAVDALMHGKSVHIEKPPFVSIKQLRKFCAEMYRSKGKVRIGFNRPQSKLGKKLLRYFRNEEGPSMLNWFIAGHEIDAKHWYFNKEEGGRVLGNICHWTDFIYHLVDKKSMYPIRIIPTSIGGDQSNIVVSYAFSGGDLATISFSAKGHTFEGVREKFSGHKGNLLAFLSDFEILKVEIVEKKNRHSIYLGIMAMKRVLWVAMKWELMEKEIAMI